jgi:hypothetical protein
VGDSVGETVREAVRCCSPHLAISDTSADTGL